MNGIDIPVFIGQSYQLVKNQPVSAEQWYGKVRKDDNFIMKHFQISLY